MSSIIKGKKIGDVNKDSLQEIKDRKDGVKSTGIKLRWNHLNEMIGGGLQPGFNYLIAALSGSGKSTYANIIETDIFDLNPEADILCLNFNFETPSIMNLMKKYSADVDMTVNDIMSSSESLSDAHFEEIAKKSERYDKYQILYFDISGSVDEVENTVLYYSTSYPEKQLVCMMDHTLLATKMSGQNELELVTELSLMSIRSKKSTGAIWIFLSQLNSEIEKFERKMNPAGHVPDRNDVFGGKAIYNAMDFVFMPHRPEILNLTKYTVRELETKDKIYFHVKKARFGAPGTVVMDSSNLKHNKIEEIEVLT